jgi:hypothetical protein
LSDATRAFGALRRLGPALHAVAALLVLVPLVDFLTSIFPLVPADARWRFGALGIFAGYLLTPLLGLALASITAAALQQVGLLRLLAWLSLCLAIALVGLAAAFALDTLQVRAGAPADGAQAVLVSGVRGVVKYLATAVTLVLLFVGARRAADAIPVLRPGQRLEPIVGSARSTATA